MGRVLNKIKGTGNPPSLKNWDPAHNKLYIPVATLSSGIGQRKGVIDSIKVNERRQNDSTSIHASVDVNGKCQMVYPSCKDVYTRF